VKPIQAPILALSLLSNKGRAPGHFGPVLHPCGYSKTHQQNVQKRENLCGAGDAGREVRVWQGGAGWVFLNFCLSLLFFPIFLSHKTKYKQNMRNPYSRSNHTKKKTTNQIDRLAQTNQS
jgi:CRISPR/Cas system CSM-associated protein Csm3 (group 7 of RAMP superfamily)